MRVNRHSTNGTSHTTTQRRQATYWTMRPTGRCFPPTTRCCSLHISSHIGVRARFGADEPVFACSTRSGNSSCVVNCAKSHTNSTRKVKAARKVKPHARSSESQNRRQHETTCRHSSCFGPQPVRNPQQPHIKLRTSRRCMHHTHTRSHLGGLDGSAYFDHLLLRTRARLGSHHARELGELLAFWRCRDHLLRLRDRSEG